MSTVWKEILPSKKLLWTLEVTQFAVSRANWRVDLDPEMQELHSATWTCMLFTVFVDAYLPASCPVFLSSLGLRKCTCTMWACAVATGVNWGDPTLTKHTQVQGFPRSSLITWMLYGLLASPFSSPPVLCLYKSKCPSYEWRIIFVV